MENAINGMAGAINSIKGRQREGLPKRAYDAFKTNVSWRRPALLRPATAYM